MKKLKISRRTPDGQQFNLNVGDKLVTKSNPLEGSAMVYEGITGKYTFSIFSIDRDYFFRRSTVHLLFDTMIEKEFDLSDARSTSARYLEITNILPEKICMVYRKIR